MRASAKCEVVTGITAAIGYGLGCGPVDLARVRRPGPRRWAWSAFSVSAGVLFGLGQYWQYDIRKLMGVTTDNTPLVIVSPPPSTTAHQQFTCRYVGWPTVSLTPAWEGAWGGRSWPQYGEREELVMTEASGRGLSRFARGRPVHWKSREHAELIFV